MFFEQQYRPDIVNAIKKSTEQIADGDDGVMPVFNTLKAIYRRVFSAFYSTFLDEQKSIMSFECKRSSTDYAKDFIELHALERAGMIAATSKERIKKIIEGADGLSEAELRDLIVQSEGGQMAAWRAAMIARTEVHFAQVSGTHQAALSVQEDSSIEYEKEWVSAVDSRTRDDHADADGQLKALDKPFSVGGENVDLPGHGSARNSINCRCVVLYNPKV